MKRRTTTKPCAVYRYGLLAPVENGDLVIDQMRKAHRYRNLLVEIEQAKRGAVEVAQAESVPAIDRVRARIAELDAQAESMWSGVDRKKVSKADRQNIKDAMGPLNAERLALRAHAKALKAEHAEILKAAYAVLNERKTVLVKAARAQCGVYWGTYLLVEKAVEDGAKKPEGVTFKRWDGRGRIGVQLQGGEDAAGVMGDGDTRLQVIDKRCGRQPKRHLAPDSRYKTLRIRVGSDGVKPVWATFPLFMDRPLPPNTRIKNAYVTMNEVSPSRVEWHACFTIESDALAPAVVHRGRGTVAVNLGWRQMDGYIRAATWVADDGRVGEVRVPSSVTDHATKADSLRSIRDREFAAAVETLQMLGKPLAARGVAPEWLRDALRWCHAWKSPARLVGIVERWRDRRFDGDAELFDAMEAWRRQERHLKDWENNARVKADRVRNSVYREAALSLVRGYTTVLVDNTDLRVMAVKAAQGPVDKASSNRFSVASGMLRQEIVSCGRKHGAEVVKVPSAAITKTCHACGGVCDFDACAHIKHTCEHCGVAWDQDVNACKNMLGRVEVPVAAE